ncbi:MAG: RNA-directed DNA polymerase [Puia sp.]|nr:RNA-directed DNA polymerase [Puia sp.]
MHTKSYAKTNRRSVIAGNIIDECVRSGQSGQTMGIPIGTDTSRIIAEIIGCSIDEALVTQLRKEGIAIKGYRFVDDCHFFFHTQSDAEKALMHFYRILSDLSLSINEEKTLLTRAPFQFDSNWSRQISGFVFRNSEIRYQRLDIRHYFNLLIQLSKQFPNDSVIKYGIKRLKNLKINKANWELFESILYSLCIAEGAILPDMLSILLQNKTDLDLSKLQSIIEALLNQHVYKGNHFEVAWSLWMARSFGIQVTNSVAQEIADSKDIVSIIILLDLIDNKLVSGPVSTSAIAAEFRQEGLLNEYWMLVYEANHKGWVASTVLSTVSFFQQISTLGISFYDNTRQVAFGSSNIWTGPGNTPKNAKPTTAKGDGFVY